MRDRLSCVVFYPYANIYAFIYAFIYANIYAIIYANIYARRDVSITQALHEGGIGPISVGVIGSPETSHADHEFMTSSL